MQLEIKVVIDFGEDGPPDADMKNIQYLTGQRLHGHVFAPLMAAYDAQTTASMGWTSYQNDEE